MQGHLMQFQGRPRSIFEITTADTQRMTGPELLEFNRLSRIHSSARFARFGDPRGWDVADCRAAGKNLDAAVQRFLAWKRGDWSSTAGVTPPGREE